MSGEMIIDLVSSDPDAQEGSGHDKEAMTSELARTGRGTETGTGGPGESVHSASSAPVIVQKTPESEGCVNIGGSAKTSAGGILAKHPKYPKQAGGHAKIRARGGSTSSSSSNSSDEAGEEDLSSCHDSGDDSDYLPHPCEVDCEDEGEDQIEASFAPQANVVGNLGNVVTSVSPSMQAASCGRSKGVGCSGAGGAGESQYTEMVGAARMTQVTLSDGGTRRNTMVSEAGMETNTGVKAKTRIAEKHCQVNRQRVVDAIRCD